MAIIVGTMLNFPACKQKQASKVSVHHTHSPQQAKTALLLLYLAIDHYIKADSVDFIQGAESFTVLILVISCVSVGLRTVNKRVQWNSRNTENRVGHETEPEVVS